MRMKFNNRKGFTLTEMMISIFVFLVIGGGLLTLFLVGSEAWQGYEANLMSQREIRSAIMSLGKDLREANSIVVDQTSDSVNLSFTIPDEGDISYSWTSVSGSDANQLIRSTDTVTRIIAKEISALSITDSVANNDVTINITSTVNTSKGRASVFQMIKKIGKH